MCKVSFPDTPILALTATATAKVCDDLKSILRIPNAEVFKASINRPNLLYEVRPKPADAGEHMDQMATWIAVNYPEGDSGIIYCLTRKDCCTVAQVKRRRRKDGQTPFYGQPPFYCLLLLLRMCEPCETPCTPCLPLPQPRELAQHLRDRGLSCCHYHADMDAHDRLEAHEHWASGRVQIIVATIAFGMVGGLAGGVDNRFS